MNLFPVVLFLSCALCGMAAALGMAVCRLRHQEQSMENAAHQIAEYILDRRKGGIECSEEGAMYRLFHEVNSLVTTADAATVREFTSLSEQELDRIESLVQSLLKMARLDAGAITLERSPENVFDLLEHIKRQYSFRAEQEGKEIVLEGDEQTVFSCDRTWLTEAIGNLVKNALDHTAQGDRIWVRWQQSPCLTQITVEDTGSGIHSEDLYHIFKRFYRSRFSKDMQGVGLGLPLAKSIVEAHQGSIEVHSKLGQGTAFTINFPIMTK